MEGNKESSNSTIFNDGFEFRNKTFNSFINESEQREYENETISFTDCVFKEPIIIKHLNAKEIGFVNCKFEKEAFLSKCEISIIGFTNCQFSYSLTITENKCESFLILRKLKISELIVEGSYNKIQIVSSEVENVKIKDVNSNPSFKNSTVEFLIENKIKELRIEPHNTFSQLIFKGSDYDDLHFEGTFNNRIVFEANVQCKNLYFESSTFNYRIDFEKVNFETVSLYRSVFNGLVFISDFDSQDAGFTRFLIIKTLSVHSCIFNKDFNVWMSHIEDISLSNNVFNQIFHFNNYNDEYLDDKIVLFRCDGINRGTVIIERTYLDISIGGINFGDIFIKDLPLNSFYLTELDNKGSISLTNIGSGIYFTIQDSVSGKLNFINTNINNFSEIVIANSNIDGIALSKYPNKIRSFSSNSKIGYGIRYKSKNISNLKHVFNQLKQVAKKNGDIDVANKYQSLEYKQLLLSKRIGWDSILLALNWLSNNNGKSWFRGILFTLGISFLFFYLYLTTLCISFDYKLHLKDYVLFLTSFPKLKLDKFSESDNIWYVSLIIWLSRIFISYGIYQTISAFRKYGKM